MVCLRDIPNIRGSCYTGYAIEMRDTLPAYVNSPFGKVPPLAIRLCPSHGRERKLTGVINNMKVN